MHPKQPVTLVLENGLVRSFTSMSVAAGYLGVGYEDISASLNLDVEDCPFVPGAMRGVQVLVAEPKDFPKALSEWVVVKRGRKFVVDDSLTRKIRRGKKIEKKLYHVIVWAVSVRQALFFVYNSDHRGEVKNTGIDTGIVSINLGEDNE